MKTIWLLIFMLMPLSMIKAAELANATPSADHSMAHALETTTQISSPKTPSNDNNGDDNDNANNSNSDNAMVTPQPHSALESPERILPLEIESDPQTPIEHGRYQSCQPHTPHKFTPLVIKAPNGQDVRIDDTDYDTDEEYDKRMILKSLPLDQSYITTQAYKIINQHPPAESRRLFLSTLKTEYKFYNKQAYTTSQLHNCISQLLSIQKALAHSIYIAQRMITLLQATPAQRDMLLQSERNAEVISGIKRTITRGNLPNGSAIAHAYECLIADSALNIQLNTFLQEKKQISPIFELHSHPIRAPHLTHTASEPNLSYPPLLEVTSEREKEDAEDEEKMSIETMLEKAELTPLALRHIQTETDIQFFKRVAKDYNCPLVNAPVNTKDLVGNQELLEKIFMPQLYEKFDFHSHLFIELENPATRTKYLKKLLTDKLITQQQYKAIQQNKHGIYKKIIVYQADIMRGQQLLQKTQEQLAQRAQSKQLAQRAESKKKPKITSPIDNTPHINSTGSPHIPEQNNQLRKQNNQSQVADPATQQESPQPPAHTNNTPAATKTHKKVLAKPLPSLQNTTDNKPIPPVLKPETTLKTDTTSSHLLPLSVKSIIGLITGGLGAIWVFKNSLPHTFTSLSNFVCGIPRTIGAHKPRLVSNAAAATHHIMTHAKNSMAHIKQHTTQKKLLLKRKLLSITKRRAMNATYK